MKLMDQDFDPASPESYPWGSLDSRVGSEAGERIANAIRQDLRKSPEDRCRVPGLRAALCELAVTIEAMRTPPQW